MAYALFTLLLAVAQHSQGTVIPQVHIFGDGFAEINKPFTLNCTLLDRVPDHREKVYTWFKNSSEVKGQSVATLTFDPVRKEDEGVYTCAVRDARTGATSASSNEITLHVHTAEEINMRPKIRPDGLAIEHHEFSMRCESFLPTAAAAQLTYTWFKNSVQMKVQRDPALHFTAVRDEDEAVYTCTFRDDRTGTTSPSSEPVRLTVCFVPEVHIEPASPKAIIKEILGKNLTLTCNVTRARPAVLPDGFQWSFSPSFQREPRPLDGNAAILPLSPLTKEHSGQYFCQARNEQRIPPGNASVSVDVVYLEKMQLLGDREVGEGDRVNLTCVVDSNPTARLAWSVDGGKVQSVVGNKDSYILQRAACSDSKRYTCHASNPDMPDLEKTVQARLHVRCEPVTPSLQVEISPVDIIPDTVKEGRRVTLTCKVIRAFPPVPKDGFLWTFSKDPSLGVKKTFSSNGNALLLEQVTESMSGWYTCQASNKPGLDPGISSVYLHVVESVEDKLDREKEKSSNLITALSITAFIAICITILFGCKSRSTLIRSLFQKTTDSVPLLSVSTDVQVDFNTVWKNGFVYVLPPIQTSRVKFFKSETMETLVDPAMPPLPIGEGRVIDKGKEESGKDTFKGEEAKRFVIKMIHEQLQSLTRPTDSPVFVFPNLKLSETSSIVDAVILHKHHGLVVVEIKAVDNPAAHSRLREAAQDLQKAREDIGKELQGLLVKDDVTLFLALPNLTGNINFLDEPILRDNPDIKLLIGRNATTLDWFTRAQRPDREAWKRNPNSDEAFQTAVKKFLPNAVYGVSGAFCDATMELAAVHRQWLVPAEQALVTKYTDPVVYLQGTPGAATNLLLHRARKWLAEGKTLLLAVGDSRHLFLLDHLYRTSLGKLPTDDRVERLVLCHDAEQLKMKAEELQRQVGEHNVCAIVDELRESFLSAILDVLTSSKISQAWTSGQDNLRDPLKSRFNGQRGRLKKLSYSVGNAPHILDMARNLQQQSPDTPAITCYPNLPARSVTASTKILFHASHQASCSLGEGPDHFNCHECKNWLKSSLSPLMDDLSSASDQWRHWTILGTGDFATEEIVTPKLVKWLKELGVPALYEWRKDSTSDPLASQAVEDRDRIASGRDKGNSPAVHVLPATSFAGVKKPCILLIHWDRKDEEAQQDQSVESERQLKHREQWLQAVSCSHAELVIWLLSPSPAAVLLQ